MKKTIIIGGVAGGASCAARLRRLDEEMQIILLERSAYVSYANCGLPYHVGGVIKNREQLMVQAPEVTRDRFNIDVRTMNEALAIDRANKTVRIKNRETGEEYDESYDTLVISTGSSPLRPNIPGIDSPKIRTLWTIPDADRIRAMITEEGIKSAAVVGGGFIGLEMAENLHRAGVAVSIIEGTDQVMAPLDPEMALLLAENIQENGVQLLLGSAVTSFEDTGDSVTVSLADGRTVTADLIILSIGVRPNSQLAADAGLALNARGGIVVDDELRTEDPDIYAVGDVIEVTDFNFGGKTMVPLAGPANKQGRIAADNIAGGHEKYEGTMGTSVAQVFDLTAASTGANEKTLIARGLVFGKDYERLLISQNSHAGYYPGAVPMMLKLLFAKDGSRIYGAQIVGRDGVDKRIDVLATAIRLGAEVSALKKLELAYAPPFSSAKDPVNMAGFVAENILDGGISFAAWDVEKVSPNAVYLDVREEAELMAYSLPLAVHVPLGELRSRLEELAPYKDRELVVFCAAGIRAYNAARILMQNGFTNVKVYPGGVRFYRSTHPQPAEEQEWIIPEEATDMEKRNTPEPAAVSVQLDCSGLQCPGPILKVFEAMKEMQDGEVMEVSASDPGFAKDIGAWCRRTGNTLISQETKNGLYTALVRKGNADAPAAEPEGLRVTDTPDGKTIIVFSGDLDRVLASFIIANGAAAMGRKVTMFFTFWGLTALRKPKKQKVKKTFMESMFGKMLPRGTKKLKLSKMNMGGMGTKMMKKIMNDKNVDSLEDLMAKAMANGVKIIACTMSMDVMGIKPEELIDGVEFAGVGTYLGDAEESNINLFI